jgi:hypothetical protein
VTTDKAGPYLRVLDQLVPAAAHVTERYSNNRIESDHGRLKAWLRPMRGLKRLCSAERIAAGQAFAQNLRRGHYEPAADAAPPLRLATAFIELVGWRLGAEHWGHGFASEAARVALRYGFTTVGLDEIVSFTAVGNVRSQAVMQRIGLRRDPSMDFDHPSVPEGHPVRPHVFYRLTRAQWQHQQI